MMTVIDARMIGARARRIRRRRGLSLDVVAGLAGITAPYLSMLERGQRGFNRRGLIEDLAGALGCPVAELTGQPYTSPGIPAEADQSALSGLILAFHDFGAGDIPDVTPRSLDELVSWADRANRHRDCGEFIDAGRELGVLLTELQVHALTTGPADRYRAFRALSQSWVLAGDVAIAHGNCEFAASAASRGYEMACRSGDPGLLGFARWWWSIPLMKLGARGHAGRLLTDGADALTRSVHLTSRDTVPAEMLGMMHLSQALLAARGQDRGTAEDHLAEAALIATRIGECNSMCMHFGLTNLSLWRLAVGLELGDGARAYEVLTRTPPDLTILNSNDRLSSMHLQLAGALAQDGPGRDRDVIRHLEVAERLASLRVRHDPIARDLVLTLDRRAPRRVWELDSLRHRFGLSRHN